jgi:hypothetical protein
MIACVASLASSARAEDASSPIRDEAHLFHADAIALAEERIDAIRRAYGHKLFVETVAAVAPHERKLFRFLWTRQVNRILEEQARKRADAAGVDGIFVVICNDPKDIHIVVRPAEDPDFTRHDAESLRRSIARRLQESGPDAGLLALTEQVRAILKTHATRGQSTSVVNEYILLGLVSGGVGLWLVLAIVRFRMRAGQADTAGAGGVGATALHRPALLGAMFGSPAGAWIYDKLYPDLRRSTAGSAAKAIVPLPQPEQTAITDRPVEDPIADEPVSP